MISDLEQPMILINITEFKIDYNYEYENVLFSRLDFPKCSMLAPIEEIDLDMLVASQEQINILKVEEIILKQKGLQDSSGRLPLVICYDDVYHIVDGHHRLVAHKRLKNTTATVRLLKL